jgi:SHS2 domain-containing protein
MQARSATIKKPYRLVSHTADLGMEVRGKDLPDLFAQAGWAFFDIMIDIRRIDSRQERLITVEAPDREALLVAWLGELLFLFETRYLIFGKFTIQLMTPNKIQALGSGELFDSKKHSLKLAIKAVTYHKLRIWEEKGVWRARVIFDL